MAINIVVSDTVGIKVKGFINNEEGIGKPFDFGLTCTRLDADEIAERLKADSDRSIIDFMADVILDWSGVKGEDGKPSPYSEESWRRLCKIPGVALLAFRTYSSEVGAKEKN